MSDFFHNSKRAIARAKSHINDFERQNTEFFATNPYVDVVEFDANTVENVCKVKLVKPIPVELPDIAFDAINNLRSALDRAAFALEFGKGGTEGKFPFSSSVTEFANTIKGRCKHLHPDITNLISTFKPYKGGNDLLWCLNKICNTNKHAVIRPYAIASDGIYFNYLSIRRGQIIIPVWDRSKNEMELFRQPRGETLYADVEYTTFIAICDVEIIDGKPVLAILHNFLSIVEGIVLALETEARRLRLIT